MSDLHRAALTQLVQQAPLRELLRWHAEGHNVLTYLVLRNDFELASSLLRRGFPPDHNNYGFATSALSEAAFSGNVEAVRFLLSNGADINGHKHEDMPPLHVALIRGHDSAAKELLEAGAAVNTIDQGGKTALDRATSPEVLELIRSAGGVHGRQ
jgi:ankyrin repeat protein